MASGDPGSEDFILERSISIAEFIRKIKKLPSDAPVHDPNAWYTTQKEHWLGWLSEYDGPGAYGRQTGMQRDAKYAYNHVVQFKMLLWLIEASGVRTDLVEAARRASEEGSTLMHKSGAIRKAVPWHVVYGTIWGRGRVE